MAHPISEQNTQRILNFDPGLTKSLLTEEGLQVLKDQKEKVEGLKAKITGSPHEQGERNDLVDMQSRKHATENLSVEAKNAILPLVMMMSLDKELFSLPFISDPNSKLLNLNQQQIAMFRFFKSIALTAASTAKLLNEGDIDVLKYFAAEFSRSSFRLVIQETDLKYLDEWVKEIVDCQRLFRKFLPSPTYEKGNSKGFSCTIKKNGELRGWLFGTMHNFTTKEMHDSAKLSEAICQRLRQCSILGTEIKIPSGTENDSVEDSLIKFANGNAIVNLGFDSVERSEGEIVRQKQDGGNSLENPIIDENLLLKLIQTEGISGEKKSALQWLLKAKQSNNKILNQFAHLYQEGDYQLIETYEKARLESGLLSEPSDIDIKRQAALIQNTHACLLALEKTKDPSMETPKGFFAYGFAHLFSDKVYLTTLVNGLRELGWEIETEIL